VTTLTNGQKDKIIGKCLQAIIDCDLTIEDWKNIITGLNLSSEHMRKIAEFKILKKQRDVLAVNLAFDTIKALL